jgi:hypothetical protein
MQEMEKRIRTLRLALEYTREWILRYEDNTQEEIDASRAISQALEGTKG